ncbi:MAG: ABC transporter permease [Bacteriovoracaceae bacterium]
MRKAERALVKVLLLDWTSIKFAVGVILGMSFSIAVILCTVGLMDGFENTLKLALKKTQGDFYFFSKTGFFKLQEYEKNVLDGSGVKTFSEYIETEAFLIDQENPQAVLMRGVEPESYSSVTGLNINPSDSSVIIGMELSKKLNLKVGDEIAIALASGNRNFKGLPLIIRLKIEGVIEHGIYQKDLRILYVNLNNLQTWLNTEGKVNVVTGKLERTEDLASQNENIDYVVYELEEKLGLDFRVRPYWHEFSTLIEAVQVEKVMIGLILQIIVIVSIFNVIAFTTFINERKAKDIFLFRALGLSQRRLARGWFALVFILWICSVLFSNVFVTAFDWLLANWSFFKLPGDIYYLARMQLKIAPLEYAIVFGISLIWILLLATYGLIKMSRQSLLSSLRKEFT